MFIPINVYTYKHFYKMVSKVYVQYLKNIFPDEKVCQISQV